MLALHSHSQDVTGRVHASWRSVLMFGKWTESQSLIAADVVAVLLSSGIFSYCNFQRVISNATSSGDGKSSWYNSSAVMLTCSVQITVDTSPRRDAAVIASEENCSSRSEMNGMAAFFLR